MFDAGLCKCGPLLKAGLSVWLLWNLSACAVSGDVATGPDEAAGQAAADVFLSGPAVSQPPLPLLGGGPLKPLAWNQAILGAREEVGRSEGLLLCPEGAATYAAYKQALADGRMSGEERVVLYNCATGLKYPLPPVGRHLDRRQPVDYSTFGG